MQGDSLQCHSPHRWSLVRQVIAKDMQKSKTTNNRPLAGDDEMERERGVESVYFLA